MPPRGKRVDGQSIGLLETEIHGGLWTQREYLAVDHIVLRSGAHVVHEPSSVLILAMSGIAVAR